MVKTNVNTRQYNAVPPYRKFKMGLKLRKNIIDAPMYLNPTRVPSNVANVDLNAHHRPTHSHMGRVGRVGIPKLRLPTMNAIMINPFNDPPINSTETDLRWIWRTKLEQKRGHINNRKFYSAYVGSKKSRQFYVIRTNDSKNVVSHSNRGVYKGTHHLKHLVKLGCPKHDLAPILHDLGYRTNPAFCSHKSHICSNCNTEPPKYLISTLSLNGLGLVFKRNAFSTAPLRIEYKHTELESATFGTDIYIKRISNTNFSKAFRPGSYGKLESLKKGSWKEGKIFYVFDNDELRLNISDNIQLSFALKSCASSAENEENTIDGWKSIVGGVGFYKPPNSPLIASVLVLRKHTNFPLECLQNSSVKIYSNIASPSGVLYIGDQILHLRNVSNTNTNTNTNANVIPPRMPSMTEEYNLLLQRNSELQSLNMALVRSNDKLGNDKLLLEAQIKELQSYMCEQHQQITKLSQEDHYYPINV